MAAAEVPVMLQEPEQPDGNPFPALHVLEEEAIPERDPRYFG